MSAMYDRRAGELLSWQAETGLPLPMTVEEILTQEDAGNVVDLAGGDVLLGGVTVGFTATVIGEAWEVAECKSMQHG